MDLSKPLGCETMWLPTHVLQRVWARVTDPGNVFDAVTFTAHRRGHRWDTFTAEYTSGAAVGWIRTDPAWGAVNDLQPLIVMGEHDMPMPIYERDIAGATPRTNPLRAPDGEVAVSLGDPGVLDQMVQWALTSAPQFALLIHPDIDLDRFTPMVRALLASRIPQLIHPDNTPLFGHHTPKGGFSLVQVGGGTVTPIYAKTVARTNPRSLTSIPRRVFLPAYAAALDSAPLQAPTVTTSPATAPEPTEALDALAADNAALRARLAATEKSLREARRDLTRLHRDLDTGDAPDESTPEPDPTPTLTAATEAAPAATPAEAWDRGVPGEAIALARTHLTNLVILPTVDTTRLDQEGKASNWGDRAWAILATLNAYAADPNRGSLYDWLRAHPSPRIASRAFSLTESDTVNASAKFRAARTFPVPTHIHPDGEVYMPAHARVDAGGRGLAPRLYFHDATNTDGKVYIGYLGPHLPNTKTT